eukprot:364881-Chlamydomonas_euryale.AAC.3
MPSCQLPPTVVSRSGRVLTARQLLPQGTAGTLEPDNDACFADEASTSLPPSFPSRHSDKPTRGGGSLHDSSQHKVQTAAKTRYRQLSPAGKDETQALVTTSPAPQKLRLSSPPPFSSAAQHKLLALQAL